MSNSMERLAEAIAFAHEVEAAGVALESGDARELERVAAIAAGALSRALPPPATLSSRLAADALSFCSERHATHGQGAHGHATHGHATHGHEVPGFTTPLERRPGALLWFVVGAAAAGLALWLAMAPGAGDDRREGPMRELRVAALASGEAERSSWSSDKGDAPEGDVVWRQRSQDGWLTFRDLPQLPEDQAYQLWIVDGTRAGDPVDGGVFTVEQGASDLIVPIRASLPIGRAASFVVTVEDRRGVVVSKQERVVAVASL